MSNKNYTNYSAMSFKKPFEKTAEPVEVKEEVTVEPTPVEEVEVKEEPTPVEEVKPESTPTPVEEVKPEPTPAPKPVVGTVTGCAKLNVRKEANTEAEVVGVINEGSEVVINRIKSTVDFYAVCTAAGIEGFCMKKFITVK